MDKKYRFLVTNFRGSSFRLLELDEQKQYRVLRSDFPCLVIGTLILADQVHLERTLINKMNILFRVKGDASKKRVEVAVAQHRLGDLIDGVPILNIGKSYYVQGEERAYAYFSTKPSHIV